MSNTFRFKIETLQGNAFDSDILSVSVETSQGDIEILYNHEPYISLVEPGHIRILTKENQTILFAVSKGIVKVEKKHDGNVDVVILSDFVNEPKVDENEIEKRLQLAQQEAKEVAHDPDSFEFAYNQVELEKQLSFLKTVHKFRK